VKRVDRIEAYALDMVGRTLYTTQTQNAIPARGSLTYGTTNRRFGGPLTRIAYSLLANGSRPISAAVAIVGDGPALPGAAVARRAHPPGSRGAAMEDGQCKTVRDQGDHDSRRGLERPSPPSQQRCVLTSSSHGSFCVR
jgi:hypothetical protein